MPSALDGEVAIAGRGLDLSGIYSCSHAECLIDQVDTLFNEVWHYFDRVVVEGPSPRLFLQRGGEYDDLLEQQVQLLLHLRSIGALPYLDFKDKPHAFCTDHFRQSAQEGGLDYLLDEDYRREFEGEVLKTAKLEELPNGQGYQFSYGDSGLAQVFQVRPGHKPGRKPRLKGLASREFNQLATALVGDIALARQMGAPLIQGAQQFLPSKDLITSPTTPAAVALQLSLPIIERIPAKELIQLRQEYQPELIRFRTALRKAIREAVKADPTSPSNTVASDVVREFIEPELAAIDVRLKAARDILLKKSALNLAVGTVVTGVGLLAAAPLVLGAGITALGATAVHVAAYVDDTADLQMSEMQFLWRARRLH